MAKIEEIIEVLGAERAAELLSRIVVAQEQVGESAEAAGRGGDKAKDGFDALNFTWERGWGS